MCTLPIYNIDQNLSYYIRKISNFPVLTLQEEKTFVANWLDNKCIKSAHRLVTSHLRLVVKIAMGFKYYGLPVMDLISEGNIGLMSAVKKFDPAKGCRLVTYAIWWIKAFIQDYILKSWSLVKIGTSAAQKKLFYSLSKIRKKIITSLDGKDVSKLAINKMIAKEANVSEKDVVEMSSRLSNEDCSIYNSVGNNGLEIVDTFSDKSKNQEELYIDKNDLSYKRKILKKAIEMLSEREKIVFSNRYLVAPALTLKKISAMLCISNERVRQIEVGAVKKIKEAISKISS